MEGSIEKMEQRSLVVGVEVIVAAAWSLISQHAGTGRIYPGGAGLAGASDPLTKTRIVVRHSDGAPSFSHSPRTECHDIARNDLTYLTNSSLHCSMYEKHYVMWSVVFVNSRVSLPRPGHDGVPELRDGEVVI